MGQIVVARNFLGVVEAPPIYSKKLAKHDFVRLSASGFLKEIGAFYDPEVVQFKNSWGRLETDKHMADGGTSCRCGHGTFSATRAGGLVVQQSH